jgi:hypothetical protein
LASDFAVLLAGNGYGLSMAPKSGTMVLLRKLGIGWT